MCLTNLNYPPTSHHTLFPWVVPEHWLECLVSCIKLALVICFSHMEIYISMLFSQIIPPFLLPAVAAAATAKSLQSCPTPCDTIDGSPPGSPIPGILQARTLEWVAIFFSRAWKWSHSVLSDSLGPDQMQPTRLLCPWDSPGKSTGVGCDCLLHSFSHIVKNSVVYICVAFAALHKGSSFSSVQMLSPNLSDPMECIIPVFPVHYQLPELALIHVHLVDDDIQPSHPLSSSSPPAVSLPQHQGLCQWLSSSNHVAISIRVSASHIIPAK